MLWVVQNIKSVSLGTSLKMKGVFGGYVLVYYIAYIRRSIDILVSRTNGGIQH
jgi:hypothetical protein